MSNPAKNPHAVALGKLGGAVKSIAKAEAVCENGRLGGRPEMLAACKRCGKVLNATARRRACPKH